MWKYNDIKNFKQKFFWKKLFVLSMWKLALGYINKLNKVLTHYLCTWFFWMDPIRYLNMSFY